MGCLYQIIVFPSHVDGPSGAGPIRILGVMKSRSVGLVKILPDTCAVVGLALEMFACMNSFKIAIGSFNACQLQIWQCPIFPRCFVAIAVASRFARRRMPLFTKTPKEGRGNYGHAGHPLPPAPPPEMFTTLRTLDFLITSAPPHGAAVGVVTIQFTTPSEVEVWIMSL